MRALVVVTIVMGVMIVVGTAGLVVVVVQRLHAAASGSSAGVVATSGGSAGVVAPSVLAEPAGTRMVGMSAAGERLAVRLEGGGPDRIVLVDPRSGAVVGRIGLAQ